MWKKRIQYGSLSFLTIHLVIQYYLFCCGFVCLMASMHLLQTVGFAHLDAFNEHEDSMEEAKNLDRTTKFTGSLLLACGLAQLIPAFACCLVQHLWGYLAKTVYVVLHLFICLVEIVLCLASLISIVNLMSERSDSQDGKQPLAILSGTTSIWLYVLTVLLLISIGLLLVLTVLLLSLGHLGPTQIVVDPVISQSSFSEERVLGDEQSRSNFLISETMNKAFNRQRLPSFSSLHPPLSSPGLLASFRRMSEVPLTPLEDEEDKFTMEVI